MPASGSISRDWRALASAERELAENRSIGEDESVPNEQRGDCCDHPGHTRTQRDGQAHAPWAAVSESSETKMSLSEPKQALPANEGMARSPKAMLLPPARSMTRSAIFSASSS